MTDIETNGISSGVMPGRYVVAIRDGEGDPTGLPAERPKRGHIYRVERVYAAPYGHGVQLAGLDPSPYAGYFLRRKGRLGTKHYFVPLEEDSLACLAELYSRA